MSGIAKFLINFLLLGALYLGVFFYYAPSDITSGEWAMKIGTILIFARIMGVFVIYRIIKTIFFSKGKPFILRILAAIFSLPYYAIAAALIMLVANGYLDRRTNELQWQTNLVYFKDFKLTCIAAGIDDAQLQAKSTNAQLFLLPGQFCESLAADDIRGDVLSPYLVDISSGQFGIPYVTAVRKATP